MGLFDRLFTITQAAANELLDKLESPAMMLNQYVRGMQDDIAKTEQELVKQEATAKLTAQQAQEASVMVDHCEAKAMDAMKAGLEGQAREALVGKLHYAEKVKEYTQSHENAKLRIAELTRQLELAREEQEKMLKKREELQARIQRAEEKSRTAMPNFSSHQNDFDGFASRGFQRIEEKIAQWEAHLELRRNPYSTSASASASAYGTPSNPSSHAASSHSLIDEQMELLRKKLPNDNA
ncbi:phage shock protein A (PspA) family protein [Paenibacillus taihuensis]|uniref:Phage shock protein A (PspA) family protein n=1 Tax=Paenibacillus taihuensis TaxID=1156355 RepID=A0A3D9RI02_9BACL|nr:PspA/IM30 family protein [Paenibacillus taihuensis]REE78738.1 phage shock protein A (PspA) family protein [Paenibacillus taihuensis]